MGILKKLAAAGGVLAIGGGGAGYVVYQRRLKENKAITATEYNAKQNQYELKVAFDAIQKRKDVPEILFYRYTTCPFCGKAKAFLDYFDIPHTAVEVEPMFKKEISFSEYKKVPQLRFNVSGHHGPYLVDSDEIVNKLAPLVGVEGQLTDPQILKWREWARSTFVRHLVMNINVSLTDAWQGYDYIDQFDTIPYVNKVFLKVMGAPVMYLVAKYKTLPALEKAGELKPGDDYRLVLRSQVNTWLREGLETATKDKPFHGGAKPDLADIDVYGVFQSIRGHKVYDDLIATTGVQAWLDGMDAATKKPKYVAAATTKMTRSV